MQKVLTFVPGTMCDRRVWIPVWDALGDRFDIEYLPTETQHQRAGMMRLFEEASPEPLNLVAFSMGGYLALEFALNHPAAVRSLVIVCSSAFGLSESEKAERGRVIDHVSAHKYAGIPTARLHQFLHPSRWDDETIVATVRAMDRELGKEVLLAQLRETTQRTSLAVGLPGLHCPCLFIAADTDAFVSVEDVTAMQQMTPGSRLVIAEETGHLVPLERPAWLATQIAEFHAGVSKPGSDRPEFVSAP